MVSDSMFETIISPAYFSSRLEVPLGIIKSIFRDQSPWGNTVQGAERMETFLGSEIFSDFYFRHLMGVFMCNVLHVRIEAVVDRSGTTTPVTLEKEVEKRSEEIGMGEGGGGEGDVGVVNGLEDLLIRVEKGEVKEGAEKGAESVDSTTPTVFKLKSVIIKKNYGVGLFYIYSKLNHSCECNTVNQGGSEAEVSLIATVDILQGERRAISLRMILSHLFLLFVFFVRY
jgi:hypothetical protein